MTYKKIVFSFLFVFVSASFPAFRPAFYDAETVEKDCASANSDYLDVEVRKQMLLSDSAYSSGINSYSNYLISYFDNLTYNFGMNYKGSCGYVAIGMLLSYYDSYLSDDIIPEQYDINSFGESSNMVLRRNSPGILKDIISDPSDPSDAAYGFDLAASKYYSAISSLQETSLHAKLIMMGASKGYYDLDDNENPCSTTYTKRYNVLKEYLSNFSGYTFGEDYSFVSYNGESNLSLSDNVREFAIEQVSKGNPVLLSIDKNGSEGHVVIAYDYDSTLDELYCHMGWNASSTHVTVEDNGYTRYKTALAINFNLSHSHANNYAVTKVVDNTTTTSYYCYHDCHISTYTNSGVHSYDSYYLPYSSSKHKACCSCGAYVLKAHSVDSTTAVLTGGHRYANCLLCGELIDLGTTPVIELNP